MANKTTKKSAPDFKSAKFMITVLKPILDHWNRVINEAWVIDKTSTGSVVISEFNHRNDIHGVLASRIAGACDAYDWCYAIYAGEEGGIEVRIH